MENSYFEKKKSKFSPQNFLPISRINEQLPTLMTLSSSEQGQQDQTVSELQHQITKVFSFILFSYCPKLKLSMLLTEQDGPVGIRRNTVRF